MEEAKMSSLTSKILDCSEERRWIAEHRKAYAGQWVALKGHRLLSHGMDAKTVYQEARKLGVESPVVVQIESPDELPFGGW
ncbi:MAG TPA: DUF5678 domain-containing protein [Blastocatellia bacterium]|nr:DUF5678 domain-containing protein [Blastocatellia bacterium]